MTKLETQKMEGNFPVEAYEIDEFDPNTGEIKFRKRISRQDRFLNSRGQEIVDSRPMSPALGKKPEMHIRDYVKTLVHSERLMQELEAQGVETFEEANDFEVGDDYFPDSQYENDLEPTLSELIREGTASLSAKARAAEKRDHEARLKRRQARSDENGDLPLQSPEKSPRSRRKAAAADPEGSANGDQDPSESED